jgi:prephenate dehydratase
MKLKVLKFQGFFFGMKKIGIQGIKGSFHHEVAEKQFKGTAFEVLPFETFDALAQAVVNQSIDQAVMAIENSIAGSILPNYALLDRHNLTIVGEHHLGIHHQLMCLPKQDIHQLKEVHSHPMALLQCARFFEQYPHIRLVEAFDTAAMAEKISKEQLKGIGAIASMQAATLYGLEIIASSIQTIKDNVTRFVFVAQQGDNALSPNANKAALKFILDHQRGSLATVLNVMSDCQLNLTKIQSLPVIETPGKYAFFVDITFEKYAQYEKAAAILEIMAQQFKVLGVYKNGNA